MDRIVQGTAATISVTFYVDGVATDPSPDSATVQITRADGTVLVATTAATNHADTGKFTYTLTAVQTALLDTLTATWTATLSGQAQSVQTTVEVAGGVLFTVAQARTDTELANTSKYPTAKVVEYRTLAEQAFEDAAGIAFVPRYAQERLRGTGTTSLMLARRALRAVRSVSTTYPGSAAVAYTAGELAEVSFDGSQVVIGGSTWPNSYSTVSIAYEHGLDRPPLRVSRAVLLLAKQWLVEGPVATRATQLPGEYGPINLLTPGVRGSVFGVPEVDVTLQEYGHQPVVG